MRFFIRIWIHSILTYWILCPNSIEAQTRFHWPDIARFNAATYENIGECLSLVLRARDSLEWNTGVMLDTMPLTAFEFISPTPTYVTDLALRCGAYRKMHSIPMDATMPIYIQYLLLAGLDAEVDSTISRTLRAIPPGDRRAQDSILGMMFDFYLRARPIRLASAEHVLNRMLEPESTLSLIGRAKRIKKFHLHAFAAGDTVRATRSAQEMVNLNTTGKYNTQDETAILSVRSYGFEGRKFLQSRALGDSLRKSSEGYVKLLQTLEDSSFQGIMMPNRLSKVIGQQAPQISTEFWFSLDTTGARYPLQGKINLIVLMGGGMDPGGIAWILRRIKTRFPDIVMVGIDQTMGYFGRLVPPPPEKEAALRWDLATNFYRIPFTAFAVANTRFTHLDDPDRRRINILPEVFMQYKAILQKPLTDNPDFGIGIVVDKQGRIILDEGLSNWSEKKIVDVLQALSER